MKVWKNKFSLIALLVSISVLSYYKVGSLKINSDNQYIITKWDTYGYYLYLPGLFIYNDIDKLEWHEEISKQYPVVGGDRFYQAHRLDNGNRVGNYTIGFALMQAPFFLVGHQIAKHSNYKADGFSPPYQYALSIGILFYIFISLVLLRWLLLKYFSDYITAVTILLVVLATNFIQYAAIESYQIHAPLFFLYTLVLVFTYKWHQRHNMLWAGLIGFVIGISTISRPTELLMVLIPLLWNTHNPKSADLKWLQVKAHLPQLLFLILVTFVAALPQLIYWKHVTGHYFYKMGSAWDFLTPHFRVLIGFEKGWFIYTPITIFFVWGLFKIKEFPFRKSVFWFCVLNIYVIIAWRDWHYGGSYSTRALVQSYPVFALALAAFIQKATKSRWKLVFYLFAVYFTFINLFHIYQYNHSILHYNKMNFKNYKKIFLKANPSVEDLKFWHSDEE
jgi:hypothetical protein